MDENIITRKRAVIEAAGVFAAVGIYVALEILGVEKRYTIAGLGIALIVYGIFAYLTKAETFRDFGFRIDNLKSCLIPVGIWTLIAATGIIAYAVIAGKEIWKSELAVMLPLYPLYGIAQQFAIGESGGFSKTARPAFSSPLWFLRSCIYRISALPLSRLSRALRGRGFTAGGRTFGQSEFRTEFSPLSFIQWFWRTIRSDGYDAAKNS